MTEPTRKHHIDVAALDSLGTGAGSTAALATLRAGQLSKHLVLIRAVLDSVSEQDAARSGLYEGFALLADAEEREPARIGTLLRHPQVGAWAMRCLRARRTGDLGYLAALAAVAGWHAGLEFTIRIPLRHGILMLPTLGRTVLGTADATVRCAGTRLTVTTGGTTVRVPDGPGWQPLRSLHAESITVLLDDLDPFRRQPGLDVATRLAEQSVAQWQRTFEAAWLLLAARHTTHATAIAGLLRSVVPLRWAGRSRSATSPESFGAVASSCPRTATEAAVTLVHEFQHMKLGALLDLVALCDEECDRVYYAPWREDPRPAGALLQGVYAHLGVAGFWRTELAHVESAPAATRAGFEFALWREQTRLAVAQLRDSDALTPYGSRFVATISTTLDEWLAEPLPPAVLLAAREAAARHRILWRQRNPRPQQPAAAGTGPCG